MDLKILEKQKLISVIITIYNVEKYIEKCITSIINQTYKNIEIIIVDDGSTDTSGKICDIYAKQDERIKVIHKSNSGVSEARNVGLDIAKGEYVVIIDGDDYLAPNAIEVLYNNSIQENADISVCNYFKVENENEIKQHEQIQNKRFCIENDSKYNNLYNQYYIPTVVIWNKIFKRNIFKNVKFPVGKIHEDEYVICPILQEAKKISYILDEYLYYYVQRNDSITKTFNIKRLDSMGAFEERREFFKLKNDSENEYKTVLKQHRTLKNVLEILKDIELNTEENAIIKKHYQKLNELDKIIQEHK